MAPRYGVVTRTEPNVTVNVGGGQSLAIRNHCGYSDSRDAAQHAAGVTGGIFVEREEPAFSQRGAFALQITYCRGCAEGVCRISSHIGSD